ncbi:transmembrane protein 62 isoform X2 [Apis mellifera]|uniref:Transmembrane protein 62 isoform X2 n=1 Tax=Apis mellifera TaxID=7460 RepID=A0A7M7L5Z9_APIME|nr:transmembrane protein 62 isoform X2 [Apis mellifera]|eukprot:XP_026297136.1 transmembrane protein 62 isoform X2 [Apis mellifera]
MKISKSTVILLVFVLMLSIFVANVADLINVDNHVLDDTLHNTDMKNKWSQSKFYDIGASFDHLIWFLQISDIHISIFQDPFRITELKEFCNITVGTIKPSVVLASGDLTDAKAKDKMGSKQILEEWQYYKRILDDTEISKRTLWLDVRGNHGRHKESMVYLCGHYHTLGGAVPNMYTLQQAGFLELELADWKDNRMYRLGVIDHGQFSFIDIKHKEWPVVLITNPKHALYMMPRKENIMSVIKSTHIRILAFSIALIKIVEVQLDDKLWFECEHIKGPLYVLKWNTTNYREGIHTIRVRVTDIDGRETTTFQPFALDGSRLSFRILPRLILMSNVSNIFQFLFGTVLVLLVIPLCILRFLHILCERKQIHRPRFRIKFFHSWLRKLWILSTVDRLFFPLVLYALYLTVGPWAVGEVIENQTGIIFAWGTFIGNSFLPGAFTYAYGFFQLFSFHLPLMLILANRVDKRLQNTTKPNNKPLSKICFILQYLPIILLIIMQTCMAYFFWLAYGTLATILCPLRTWSIFLAMMLWHQVNTMPHSCLRSAAKIWSPLG